MNGSDSSRYFVWGLDLSQTLQGAGGIGGLLCMADANASYYYLYDANGNVGQLVNAADSSIAAHYEYDPFGNLTAKSGAYADANPFRFSTKYFDADTGLYDFGLRDYLPKLGRWTSRDPIEEEGGNNIYGFILNNPINYIDFLGMQCKCNVTENDISINYFGKRAQKFQHLWQIQHYFTITIQLKNDSDKKNCSAKQYYKGYIMVDGVEKRKYTLSEGENRDI